MKNPTGKMTGVVRRRMPDPDGLFKRARWAASKAKLRAKAKAPTPTQGKPC